MKISIITYLFLPKWIGGTEIATFNLAKQLARRGHEVHIITKHGDMLPINTFEDGFYVHRIKTMNIKFIQYLEFLIKVIFVLKDIDSEIVHFQSFIIALNANIIKLLLKKPIIIYGRGSDIYNVPKIIKQAYKPIMKNSNALIALTDEMKKEMQKLCNREIFVIPNGIDTKNYNISPINAIKDDKTIIFVGNLRKIKGVNFLIESLTILNDSCIKLLILGEGDQRKYLEDLTTQLNLNNQVKFLGKISNKDIPQYLVSSDIFVLPSISEGFPNVILEAMAAGLPIVATRIKGMSEIIENGRNGILVNPEDPIQISEGIQEILNNNKLRMKISYNNKNKVKEYDYDFVTSKIEKIYKLSIKS